MLGTRVSDFFTKNLNQNKFFLWGGGGGWGEGVNVLAARVELSQVSSVEVESRRCYGFEITRCSLTCNNSTLTAKTLFFDTLFNFRF